MNASNHHQHVCKPSTTKSKPVTVQFLSISGCTHSHRSARSCRWRTWKKRVPKQRSALLKGSKWSTLTKAALCVCVLLCNLTTRLEEGGVLTDCRIQTKEPDETLDFDFLSGNVLNKVILKVQQSCCMIHWYGLFWANSMVAVLVWLWVWSEL